MKRVVFLMSDTGGGHRAAGMAIEAALSLRFPGEFDVRYVDMYREHGPAMLRTAPEFYPLWLKHSARTYGWYFQLFDFLTRRYPAWTTHMLGRIGETGVRRVVEDHQPDLVVLLHPAFARLAVAARERLGIAAPMLTVVTDLAWPHLCWYHPAVDRCVVPCAGAYQRGVRAGVESGRLALLGHPAHPKFAACRLGRAEARRHLGWPPEGPIVLTFGGGDGVGPLGPIARALDRALPAARLAVVCGRNRQARSRLSRVGWRTPPFLYGFVKNLEVMMRAADVLVTKAGPGTIAEAAICGLPMVLSGAIPHQESPNIPFVVKNGAGVFAPGAKAVAAAVTALLRPGNASLERMGAAARRIAYPQAALAIADEVATLCNRGTPGAAPI
jgi:1,2-diacylglycerol 3-beta-galactosyltransferase